MLSAVDSSSTRGSSAKGSRRWLACVGICVTDGVDDGGALRFIRVPPRRGTTAVDAKLVDPELVLVLFGRIGCAGFEDKLLRDVHGRTLGVVSADDPRGLFLSPMAVQRLTWSVAALFYAGPVAMMSRASGFQPLWMRPLMMTWPK